MKKFLTASMFAAAILGLFIDDASATIKVAGTTVTSADTAVYNAIVNVGGVPNATYVECFNSMAASTDVFAFTNDVHAQQHFGVRRLIGVAMNQTGTKINFGYGSLNNYKWPNGFINAATSPFHFKQSNLDPASKAIKAIETGKTRTECLTCLDAMILIGQPSGPTTQSDDPFAGAEKQESTFRPIGKMATKDYYFRGEDLIGERIYYKNGQLAQERSFKDGSRHGRERLFYAPGQLYSERTYDNDLLVGKVRYFSEKGDVIGEYAFERGTGVLHEPELKEQVIVETEKSFKDGRLHGTCFKWATFSGGKGRGLCCAEYVDGQLNGWSITVDEDGSPLESATFKKGKVHGVLRTYSKGKMKDGFPKFYVDNQDVGEERLKTAAKDDPILQKSLTDDGFQWAKGAIKSRNVS